MYMFIWNSKNKVYYVPAELNQKRVNANVTQVMDETICSKYIVEPCTVLC